MNSVASRVPSDSARACALTTIVAPAAGTGRSRITTNAGDAAASDPGAPTCSEMHGPAASALTIATANAAASAATVVHQDRFTVHLTDRLSARTRAGTSLPACGSFGRISPLPTRWIEIAEPAWVSKRAVSRGISRLTLASRTIGCSALALLLCGTTNSVPRWCPLPPDCTRISKMPVPGTCRPASSTFTACAFSRFFSSGGGGGLIRTRSSSSSGMVCHGNRRRGAITVSYAYASFVIGIICALVIERHVFVSSKNVYVKPENGAPGSTWLSYFSQLYQQRSTLLWWQKKIGSPAAVSKKPMSPPVETCTKPCAPFSIEPPALDVPPNRLNASGTRPGTRLRSYSQPPTIRSTDWPLSRSRVGSFSDPM